MLKHDISHILAASNKITFDHRMEFDEIEKKVLEYHAAGKKMYATSSFQTHSIPLLHMLSRIDAPIDILFINTGFHFPETLNFRDEIAASFGLNVIDVRSSVPKNMQRENGQFYFATEPDYCCQINKTIPMEAYLMQYDIWINGIRADQNANRKNMKVEQPAPHNTLRFHPVLDWNSKKIWEYRKEYDLPEHPLEVQGYLSIGCEPCTRKFDASDERTGRWFGMNKTECGLHTDLAK